MYNKPTAVSLFLLVKIKTTQKNKIDPHGGWEKILLGARGKVRWSRQ
jgi:hypothetical protein